MLFKDTIKTDIRRQSLQLQQSEQLQIDALMNADCKEAIDTSTGLVVAVSMLSLVMMKVAGSPQNDFPGTGESGYKVGSLLSKVWTKMNIILKDQHSRPSSGKSSPYHS